MWTMDIMLFSARVITMWLQYNARYGERISVRPSVCLSVCQTHGLWQNERNLCQKFVLYCTVLPSRSGSRMLGTKYISIRLD